MRSRIRELIKLSSEISNKIPYQYISDSPTIKHYTNWAEYDKYDSLEKLLSGSTQEISSEIVSTYDVTYYVNRIFHNSDLDIMFFERNDLLNDKHAIDDRVLSLLNPYSSKIYAKHIANLSSLLYLNIHKTNRDPLKIYVGGCIENSHLAQHITIVFSNCTPVSLVIHIEPPKNCFRSVFVEYFFEEGSEAHITVINLGDKASYYSHNIDLERNSRARFYTLSLGGVASRFENRIFLRGENASYSSNNAVLARRGEWIHSLEIAHLYKPSTDVEIDMRGVALEDSRNILQGYAKQYEESIDSRVFVSVSGINIGEKSLLVTTPFIEVLNGGVREASHNASQQTLDPDQEFYLRSRGLSREEAVKIIIQSYFNDYLLKIPEKQRDYLKQILSSYYNTDLI